MSKPSSKGSPGSNSPTNFFRGLSSRLAAQPTPQKQPQPQSQGSSGSAAPSATYDPSTGQTTSALLTQATQQRPAQSSATRRTATSSGTAGAPPEATTPAHPRRVHASALIERVRQIRNQPKNTSPIDASAHPSLLPPAHPAMRGKKCLILDVDETLVHSSYQNSDRYDVHLAIPLDDSSVVDVYVAFRPHLSEFLEAIAPLFEVVIFTASLARYCNPLMDSIDQNRILGGLRLFREHCSLVSSTFVKDLSLLGRSLDHVAIIDNSPVAYLFQQRNALPITSWFDDPNDCELRTLIPVLCALAEADTVYDVLDNYNALLQLQQSAAGGES